MIDANNSTTQCFLDVHIEEILNKVISEIKATGLIDMFSMVSLSESYEMSKIENSLLQTHNKNPDENEYKKHQTPYSKITVINRRSGADA